MTSQDLGSKVPCILFVYPWHPGTGVGELRGLGAVGRLSSFLPSSKLLGVDHHVIVYLLIIAYVLGLFTLQDCRNLVCDWKLAPEFGNHPQCSAHSLGVADYSTCYWPAQ